MSSNAVALVQDDAPARTLPSLVAGHAPRAIVPQDFEGAWRIASAVCKAGMAPRGLESPEKAMVAILHGLEIGLTPMNALQSIAVVNGRPTIWGDGAVGLARGSGLLEWMDEKIVGDGDAMVASCSVKRRNEPKPVSGTFSVADAKRAGLWGKSGPWQQYPKRMLQMRARAFVLRDGFADVLKGLSIKEEVEDYAIKTDIGAAAPTARDEPPAPPPAAASPEPTPDPTPPATRASAEPPQNPEDILAWIETTLSAVSEPTDLETVWNDMIAPRLDELFPPDQDEAMGIYRKHEARLS